ncbi:MAG: putative trifunctional protein [Subtercola sp.]|nr:putative trifunctional protein [Subtercola sp.]
MAVVSTRIDEDVAIVTIDSPPVNMGNVTLRRELLEAFTAIAESTGLVGVVLASARAHFYSGSDIKEFDGPILLPSLPEVIALIDGLDIPVVAALNGFVLGGGLEVALGCDARVADSSARLGLPETTLGMLPGAGGTVRLPRAVGVLKAIDMIATGRPITAEEALAVGLVDQVVAKDALLDTAVTLARSIPKRRLRLLEATLADAAALDEAIAKATRNGKARPNVVRAVELVRSGVGIDADVALAAERAAFDELRVGDEARNLRYLFFAKRAAAKALSSRIETPAVQTIGIAGAGTMGAGIAAVCRKAGLSVVLFDLNAEVLGRASASLDEKAAKASRWGTVTTTSEMSDLAWADLVIDAVFEEMTVKTELLTALEGIVGDEVVLASNTSYLNLDEIASALKHPERLAGLHFFNPADRNPLVEVVRTASSNEVTIATLAALVRKLGKSAILAQVGEGFVANRVYADYRGQAELLVEDGASPQGVDAAMVALGLAIGPFAVGDMSGLDIAWARRKRLAATRDPNQRYVSIPDALCEAGRLGKKTGAGWYAYPEGASRGVPDPIVDGIIAEARAAKNMTPRTVDEAEIQQRILCSMLVAAASVLDSGVAQQASDVDVALTEGFAFPAWLGGPVRYASNQPPSWVLEGLSRVYDSDPVGFMMAASAKDGGLPPQIASLLDAVKTSS